MSKLLPIGSKRRQAIKQARQALRKSKSLVKIYRTSRKLATKTTSSEARPCTYDQWIRHNEPNIWDEATELPLKPLISIVIPAYNTPDKYLDPLIQSLLDQTYVSWQACVADGSTDTERSRAIEIACRADKRIVYKRLKENRGIVGNTNEAIKLATGEFIGFLDHDDCLSPHALQEVIAALNKQPKADVFYSDEDKLSDDGHERSQPFFKPDWSPTLEEGVNYMTHFFVVRRSILKQVGVLREGFDGAQDYDFILRITDRTKEIVHIAKVLYHWRLADGSTAGTIGNKSYADNAGQRALVDHVKRQNIPAQVLAIPELPTNYRLKYQIPKGTKASIIIPFKDKPELLKTCVSSILEKTTYKNYEIILLSNNSVEAETHSYLDTVKDHEQIKVFIWDHPFNFSALNNFGRAQATGDYLVLLNNDTEVITGGWLEELLGVASQPGVGAVGPQLFYPTNKIQHAGVVLGMGGMAGHVFRHLTEDAITPFGRPYWPRNYLALTAACLVIKASKYDEVGGLDETFIMAGNDVALGISLHEKGYLNVYWPFAQLYHYENVSVGSYQNAPASDYDHSLTYYKPYLNWHDPYFNPNLDLANEQIALRRNYE